MAKIYMNRAMRRVIAFTSVDIIGAGTMIAVAAESIAHNSAHTVGTATSLSPLWFAAIAIGVLLILVFRGWLEYRRRTYDPTLAVEFDRSFNSAEMEKIRSDAATILKDNLGNLNRSDTELSDIDEVLDFLETLGFYEHGHQISPEVAHHYFYHWIRGYVQIAEPYIKAWQTKEPARWEYIKELYELTTEIETERSKGKEIVHLSADQIATFLDNEVDLSSG